MADINKDSAVAYAEERSQGSDGHQHHGNALDTNPWWKFGGRDRSFIPTASETSSTIIDRKDSRDIEDEVTLDDSVFNNAKAFDIYKPIEKYEGRHRFDPKAVWSEAEEKKLVRRLDYKVCLWACIMFFALQLDRGNIVQALSDNMLKDLGLTTNDYNNGMTIFYCSFLFAELPSQLISKKVGPDNWIPIQMISWSIVACSQSHLNGKTTFYITRFLLGLIEGGFIPDTILYLSYFYKNAELPIRLACFWTSYVGTNIVGSFLAYGILHLRSPDGWAGWRYLFAIEGGITAAIGIISFLYLPPSPTQTKRRGIKGILRPKKGWFTEREEVIMVTRILRDDPGKATMHNRQAISPSLLWASLTDYDMWPVYLIGLTWTIPFTPSTAYLSLTLRSIGFDVFETNLLIIPSSVLFILQLIFWTWFSEKFNQRFFIGLISQIWVLPLLIALETLPLKFHGAQWARFALSSLIVGYPYAHAMLGKWE
ncbi:MAG: hypothetical protein L6R41_002845 [Letrouitia leprolyta]|nr:MAG: hypothetical protein L6R41_002845 [Letrouitia leprolyta]